MGGSTKKISTAPAGSDALRGTIIDYLQRNGFDKIGAQTAGPVSVAPWSGGTMDRGQVRDVTGERTQSLDQLGGANSAFFNNMVGQLAPSFDMQRKLAAAQGSESAGNLTGSAFANRLGNNLNRTLGDQQALLADYATRGLGMEMNRQQGDANRMLAAGQGNQQADLGFLNQLLQSRGQDLTARGQDIGLGVSNASQANDMANANAQRFAALLMQQGQPFQDAIAQSGGIGALLGPLAQGLGGYYGAGGQGNPVSGIGSWIGKGIGALGGLLGIGGGTSIPNLPGIGSTPTSTGGWGGGGAIPNINPQIPKLPGFPGGNMMVPTAFNPSVSTVSGGGVTGMTNPGFQPTYSSSGPNQLLGSGMVLGPDGRPQLGNFASGENDTLNTIMQQPGMLPVLLQILTRGQLGGGGLFGGGGYGMPQQGGGWGQGIGGMLGGMLGSATPLGPIGGILGSILGRGAGGLAGKAVGGIGHLLGKIF